MQITITSANANNIVCNVTPPAQQVITIDRGVAGNGIVSIVPVTIATFQYLRITYTDGTVSDVGPLTSTAYTATAPINITGNTISLQTVPVANGGTGLTSLTANSVLYAATTNTIGQSANLTFDGSQFDVPAGSAATPAISTPSDSNTGFYFPAADNLGFSTGGAERMRIDSAGRVGIGVTPAGGATGDRLQIGLTTSTTTSVTSLYNRLDVSATSGSGTYAAVNNFVVPTASFAGTGVIVATNSSVTNQTANTVSDVRLYTGTYATTGGGTLTNLYSFLAGAATLTSGTVTNHFGFYGGIASGTGRWNFYAQGSADNYFAGNILRGRTTASTFQASIVPSLQTHGTNSVSASSIGMVAWGTTQFPILQFARSNSGVAGTQTVVASGDTLGTVDFGGSDGTGFIRAATIAAQVDGTPGTNDMPGRLVFSTTADGASSVTERARITSTGAWSFGSTGTNTGTAGQVLTSQGSGAAPTWAAAAAGITVTNDVATATDIYPLLGTITTGTLTAVNTSNNNLLYRPSTGELKADVMNAMNGIFVNSATISTNYTIASGSNAMSAGPVTVASGITVTVSSGSVWTVV